jgi:hypothetical protein
MILQIQKKSTPSARGSALDSPLLKKRGGLSLNLNSSAFAAAY